MRKRFVRIKAKVIFKENAIKKHTKGELNVRDQVCSAFSLKMHRINEMDNKFLFNSNKIKNPGF